MIGMSRVVRKLTNMEILQEERWRQLFRYYGIPYDMFDENMGSSQIDKDRNIASMLIIAGKPIPKDLEDRLLKYKEKEEKGDAIKQ